MTFGVVRTDRFVTSKKFSILTNEPIRKAVQPLFEWAFFITTNTMIKQDYWGQGIGRSLIEELISWARETNIVHKINLKVREDNMRAIKLYEDMGFIKEGHVSREFFVDNAYYGAIIMGMEI